MHGRGQILLCRSPSFPKKNIALPLLDSRLILFVKYKDLHPEYFIFCQTKSHTEILLNQSEASTSELVSSLSAYEIR